MTHASPTEIHDHAYGFRLSEHVAGCAECGRSADAVAAERETLRDVLGEDAVPVPVELLDRLKAVGPKRRRVPPAGLAAAALLLAALAWSLRQPSVPPDASLGARSATQEDDIRRLIQELKTGSPVRREIAGLALKRYGGTAAELVARAEVDPRFLDEVNGIEAQDRALIDRMKSTRLTLNFDRVVYSEVLRHLEKELRIASTEFAEHTPESAIVTLKLENVTATEAFESLCAQIKCPFGVQYGRLVVGRRPSPTSLAPVRLMTRQSEVARHIADLSNEDAGRRKAASVALRRLGFSAESALWPTLEAGGEPGRHAEALLRALYEPWPRPLVLAPEEDRRVTIDCQNAPLSEVLQAILKQVPGLSVAWDSRTPDENAAISFKVSDIYVEGALKLLLIPRGLNAYLVEDFVFVTVAGGLETSTPTPHVLWLAPDTARTVTLLIDDLSADDPKRQEKAVRGFQEMDPATAADALAYATGFLEGSARVRCQRLRRAIAEQRKIWIPDLPSGAELQKLTPEQVDVLQGTVASQSKAHSLFELVGRGGLLCEFKAPFDAPISLIGKEPRRSSLLKAVLRPQGLDFYMDGKTVVIDTAANVRKVVEK